MSTLRLVDVGSCAPPKIPRPTRHDYIANVQVLTCLVSMSGSSDFKVGSGISTSLADAARNEIHTETIQHAKGKPITFVDYKSETRAASNEFLQVATRGDN